MRTEQDVTEGPKGLPEAEINECPYYSNYCVGNKRREGRDRWWGKGNVTKDPIGGLFEEHTCRNGVSDKDPLGSTSVSG